MCRISFLCVGFREIHCVSRKLNFMIFIKHKTEKQDLDFYWLRNIDFSRLCQYHNYCSPDKLQSKAGKARVG